MADKNTKNSVRKPRTVKKEEVVKADIGSLEATVDLSEEKKQETPSADEVAALAKEVENTLEIAESEDKKPEIEDKKAGELAEADVNIVTVEEEIAAVEKEFPEAKLPEGAETFEEFTQKLDETKANTPAVVCKLNPYLEDGQSKWVAQVRANGLIHKIFKGSLPKAYNAAKNYNITHGMANAEIKKVRNLK